MDQPREKKHLADFKMLFLQWLFRDVRVLDGRINFVLRQKKIHTESGDYILERRHFRDYVLYQNKKENALVLSDSR